MIYYDTQNFSKILFSFHGSPLAGPGPRRAFVVSLLALMMVGIYNYCDSWVVSNDSTAIKDTLTVANTFMGLLVSFRLNSAFQQWRSGVAAIGYFAEAAKNLMSTACAQVNVVDQASSEQKCDFLKEFRRLILLYVAIAFHHCREVEDMETIRSSNLLTASELQELELTGSESRVKKWAAEASKTKSVALHSPNKLRGAAVELWIRRLVTKGLSSSYLLPPEANALNASVTKLTELYHTVFNISHCPIPFNYAQYLELCIMMYLFLYASVIIPSSGLYTPGWVFGWGLVLFVADDVANEIECPFGTDANDIDLEVRLLKIEDELTMLLRSTYRYGGILGRESEELASPTSKAAASSRDLDEDTYSLRHAISEPYGKTNSRSISNDFTTKTGFKRAGSYGFSNEKTPLV